MPTHDIIVIGGGIVGLATARSFQQRMPGRSVRVLEKEDRVAAQYETAAQSADRGIDGVPVRRAGAGTERLDLVAVVLHAGRVAAKAQHCLEQPLRRLVLDRGLACRGIAAAAGVAILPLCAPDAFLDEKGVVYPCTFLLSSGTCARLSIS